MSTYTKSSMPSFVVLALLAAAAGAQPPEGRPSGFAGVILAAEAADLSFEIRGRLTEVPRYLLRFAVPPSEAAQWKAGRPIQWRPDDSETSYRAVVARVAPEVDVPSQMIFVEADLEPSPVLRDGLAVRVEP